MNSSCFIIFPNQLYQNFIQLSKSYNFKTIYIIEEPIYFYDSKYRQIKPNKIKIAYMRACMKWYTSWLQSQIKNKKSIIYIEYDQIIKYKYKFLQSYSLIIHFETTDKDLDAKLAKYIRQSREIFPSPNFIMSIQQLKEYTAKHKTARHATFYDFVKTTLKILSGVENQDKYNRESMSGKNIYIPKHINSFSKNPNFKNIYQEAIYYAKNKFASHIGNAEALYLYPITHKDAYESLEYFIKTKLQSFGPYQDAILENDPFLFHSILSPMLNIGLLNPLKILLRVLKEKDNIPLNSLEGFIRQLIGWREYMRYIYLFKLTNITPNLPKNKYIFTNPLPWYNGTTGVSIIDKEIHKAVRYGYAHHIIRLMVFMNFFILCQLHPEQIYTWFMEVIAIDAYDWVMKSNVYSMGYFTKTGMNKPYISTSNYILKMSDYKKDGHWDVLWTSLFYSFIKEKSKESPEYIAFYKRLFETQYKKSPKTIENYIKTSKSFNMKMLKYIS